MGFVRQGILLEPRSLLCWAAVAVFAAAPAAGDSLFWSQGGFEDGQILQAPLDDPTQTSVLASPPEAVSGMAVDATNGKLYWTGDDTIYRANLDGSGVEPVAATRAFSEGIALDVPNQHIYWTNYNGEIRRIGFGGTGEVLLRSEGQRIYGLALDLVNRRMYWTAADHRVYRSTLTGVNRRLIAIGGDEPLGVAVDPASAKVYWAEWGSRTLRRTDLDGITAPEQIYASPSGQPIGITLDTAAGKVYWTEWTTDLVRRANLDGSGVETLVTATAAPWGLALGPGPPPPPFPITQLTHNTTLDFSPDVDRGRVVWTGIGPTGTYEIFLWDGSGITQVTADGTNERVPHISGSNIAWISDIDDDGEIFFFDGTNPPTQVSNDVINHGNFCLDGDRIAYPILDGQDLDIVIWEHGNVTQLTRNYDPDSSVCLSGDRAMWVRPFFGGSDWEVVYWDGSGETRLTDNAGDDDVPVLDGSNAAWMTWENGDWHITFWDGTSARRIDGPATNERFPDISHGRVVWSGFDGHDSEIYLWDNGQLVQLTDNQVEDYEPKISGTYVVWTGYADGDAEIYLADLPEPPAVPALMASFMLLRALARRRATSPGHDPVQFIDRA
jgi:beta propeller repeat protein